MNKQRGVSLSGLLVTLFLLFFAAILGFKLFGPYMEYFTIQKIFKAVATNPENRDASPKDIRNAFDRYRIIENNVASITPDDVEVTKEGNQITLSAAYTVKVPLVANVSLFIEFAPTSAAK
jgi:hypothetical protein